MKRAFTSLLAISALTPVLAVAAPFSMAIVADNDFAIFTGTSTSINNLLYQNNITWEQQIPNLSTLQFNMPAGDTMFYLLGMGGGGQENISGKINGVDITTMTVQESTALTLTGYPSSSVIDGSYNVSLSDVQGNFPQLSWHGPNLNDSHTVILQASPNGKGFAWASNEARLFRFEATAANVATTPASGDVPEPSTYALALLGLAVAGAVKRKRHASV